MSCFGVPEEQLYLLEVTVGCLNLSDEKLYECDKRTLVIKIKFLELPILTLSQFEFEYKDNSAVDEVKNGSIVFASGRSCLFGKEPKALVHEIQRTPVRIGIFCDDETYPIAETTLTISGCMCDQIAMAMNDKEHLPKPFVLRNRYDLVDPGANPSGSIDLELKLTCLGKYVTTHYHIMKNSFVFKGDRDEGEYFVKRVLPEDEESPSPGQDAATSDNNDTSNAEPQRE